MIYDPDDAFLKTTKKHHLLQLDCCQVSLAEPDTTFGFPEVRVGGLPAVDLS